ncbi:unnamed protein product [Heterobilharzia americana]|nr:unnamed protein product [Heterobilharzia americana]
MFVSIFASFEAVSGRSNKGQCNINQSKNMHNTTEILLESISTLKKCSYIDQNQLSSKTCRMINNIRKTKLLHGAYHLLRPPVPF